MKIRSKILIFFIMASALPVITVIAIFSGTISSIMIEKDINYSVSMSVNKSQAVDRVLGDIENALLNVCTNPSVIDFLDDVNTGNYTEEANYRKMQVIAEKIETFPALYQEIESVYLLPREDGVPIFRGNLDMNFVNHYSNSETYTRACQSPEYIYWDLLPEDVSDRFNLTLSKGIVNQYNDEVLGALVLKIKIEDLFTSLYTQDTGSSDQYFVVDKGGQIIFSSPDWKMDSEFADETINKGMEGGDVGNFEISSGNNEYIVTYTASDITGWRIYYVSDKNHIISGLSKTTKLTWLIGLLFMAFAVVAAIYLYFTLYYPIMRMKKAMEKIRSGDLDMEVPVRSRDEIGVLSGTFNYLVGEVKKLIENTRETQRKKSELEMRALQSQIMPHFLYNTLNSIKSLAWLGKTDAISDMVEALIDLLRISANAKADLITIEEEIHHVRSYVKIMAYRYDINLTVQYNVADDILDCQIPKFSLQPIVENSILHGFNEDIKEAVIDIRVYGCEGFLYAEVSDNGIGMDAEKIKAIYDRLSTDAMIDRNKFTGIGIENISDRLVLEFGDEAGLTVQSKQGEGTKITLHYPVSRIGTSS